MVSQSVYNVRTSTHHVLIYVNIDDSGRKRMRESQTDASIETPAFSFDRINDETRGANLDVGATALESSGDGVDRVEDEVSQPTEKARC